MADVHDERGAVHAGAAGTADPDHTVASLDFAPAGVVVLQQLGLIVAFLVAAAQNGVVSDAVDVVLQLDGSLSLEGGTVSLIRAGQVHIQVVAGGPQGPHADDLTGIDAVGVEVPGDGSDLGSSQLAALQQLGVVQVIEAVAAVVAEGTLVSAPGFGLGDDVDHGVLGLVVQSLQQPDVAGGAGGIEVGQRDAALRTVVELLNLVDDDIGHPVRHPVNVGRGITGHGVSGADVVLFVGQLGHVRVILEVQHIAVVDDVVLCVVDRVHIVVVVLRVGARSADGIADGAGVHVISGELDVVHSVAGTLSSTGRVDFVAINVVPGENLVAAVGAQTGRALDGSVSAVNVGNSHVGEAGGHVGGVIRVYAEAVLTSPRIRTVIKLGAAV